MNVEQYVQSHSRLARMFPATSTRMAGSALRYVRDVSRLPKATEWDRARLEASITETLWDIYSTWNPVLYAVLRVLIPIVARLVVEWWDGAD